MKFKKAWLVTNTKATAEAIKYAECVGIQIVSWDYPGDFSLRYLIEKSGLHPITCLQTLKEQERRELLRRGLVFCKDLVKAKEISQGTREELKMMLK